MRKNVYSYHEAIEAVIHGLSKDIAAQESGCVSAIGTDFDAFDASLPRECGPEFKKLFIALNFWDGWIDARNHEWLYYKGIYQSDWPKLARQIIINLKNNSDISEPIILEHFGLYKPIIQRIKDHLFGEKRN